MEFSYEQVLAIISRIEFELGKRGIKKYEFYRETGISSALYSNWNTGKAKPTLKSLGKVADFLGLDLQYLISGETPEEDNAVDDSIAVRQMLRDRPEAKILFDATKDAPASALLEAAALIMRYKEESKYK